MQKRGLMSLRQNEIRDAVGDIAALLWATSERASDQGGGKFAIGTCILRLVNSENMKENLERLEETI